MTRAAAPKTPLAVLAAYLHEGVRHIWLGLEVLTLPSRWVESTIAASVILAALNNLRPLFANSRCQLAFLFGLVHGLGFANVLLALGLPTQSLAASLAGFNLGVELGQLMLMAMIFPPCLLATAYGFLSAAGS